MTWNTAASGEPDLSLTSLSQSTVQRQVQIFQNWTFSPGAQPGGLVAAGEHDSGVHDAGVQRIVEEGGEHSYGRLENAGKEDRAWWILVQRREEPPTSGQHGADWELKHQCVKVRWVVGSYSQRPESALK